MRGRLWRLDLHVAAWLTDPAEQLPGKLPRGAAPRGASKGAAHGLPTPPSAFGRPQDAVILAVELSVTALVLSRTHVALHLCRPCPGHGSQAATLHQMERMLACMLWQFLNTAWGAGVWASHACRPKNGINAATPTGAAASHCEEQACWRAPCGGKGMSARRRFDRCTDQGWLN